MIAKVLIFVCLVVCLCEAGKKGRKDHFKKEIVKEVCKGNDTPACKETVMLCIPPFDESKKAELKLKICKNFGTCLDKVTGSRTIYETFITEKRGGKDWCAKHVERNEDDDSDSEDSSLEDTKPRPIGEIIKRKKEKKERFEDYLVEKSQTTMATDFKCCLAKESGKFNADDTVNVAAWKEDLVKFMDPKVQAAYEEGIDSCATSNTACNMHDFKICTISKCYDVMKSSAP